MSTISLITIGRAVSKDFIPPAKPIIGDAEREAVDAVLRSGMLAQGSEVAAFEQEFSQVLLDGRPAVAVNAGTAGLHLGLLAAGVGPGDEVIVPSFTFAATANSVALTGATPVFADIEPDHYCLDPKHVAGLITERTKGIMPVHLYGHPANMAAFEQLAKEHGLAIYEDAAQAHGATIDGKPVGTFGSFAMFSLYPTKNMTSGEGGMVSTPDTDMERTLRLLRNQGMLRQYENEIVGFNARMTNLHAAIGRVSACPLSPPVRHTSTTSTRSPSATTGTASSPRSRTSTRSDPACTIRSRITGCLRSSARRICRTPSRRAARCCRSRSTRRWTTRTASAS
jgi:perosamine synthetase